MISRLVTGTFAAAGASSAFGAILNLDFGPAGYAEGLLFDANFSPYVYIDLGTGNVSIEPGRDPGLTEIRADFGATYYGYNNTVAPSFRFAGELTSLGVTFQSASSYWADRVGYSTELDANLRSTLFVVGEGGTSPSPWGNGFSGVGFVAFQLQGNSGWLAIKFRPDFPQRGSLELLQLQYGSEGETLTTPAAGTYSPIPEPAMAASLLAGSAAVFALRRRRR
jgi:hypothetical protein